MNFKTICPESDINGVPDKVSVSTNPHEALPSVVQANTPIGRSVSTTQMVGTSAT